jgi:hypothetical protein
MHKHRNCSERAHTKQKDQKVKHNVQKEKQSQQHERPQDGQSYSGVQVERRGFGLMRNLVVNCQRKGLRAKASQHEQQHHVQQKNTRCRLKKNRSNTVERRHSTPKQKNKKVIFFFFFQSSASSSSISFSINGSFPSTIDADDSVLAFSGAYPNACVDLVCKLFR